jgi:YVTN family beta-propeller protein
MIVLILFSALINSPRVSSFTTGHNQTINRIYVENSNDSTLSVIKGTKVITTVKAGHDPWAQMAYAPNVKEIFVPDYCSGTVSIVSTINNSIIATISGLGCVFGAAYVPPNKAVYVSDTSRNYLYEISTLTDKVIVTIKLPQYTQPTCLSFNKANHHLYLSEGGANKVAVINPSTNKIISILNVGSEPVGMTFDPANNDTYVANEQSSFISVINQDDKLIANVTGLAECDGMGPWMLAFNTNNNDMYATDFCNSRVYVIDSRNSSVIATVAGFDYPHGIAYDPSDKLIYVANTVGNTVQTINGTKLRTTINVGSEPNGIVVN